jgi:hypothetical protein
MIKYIKLVSFIFLLSCSEQEQNELDNWELTDTDIIEHLENRNQKIEIIYSTWNKGALNFNDTSLVVKTFTDTLLNEEVNYNIEDGDTIKWRHQINLYNSADQLTEEIDSVRGEIRSHHLHFYKENQLVRSENLFTFPLYNDHMEQIGTDTSRSVTLSFYNNQGKCDRVISMKKNELLSALEGTLKFDSTFTFNQFDDQGRRIGAISLMNGDTISMYRTEYNELGQKTKMIDASLEFGRTTFQFEYDKNGNVISELMLSDDYADLILTDYDDQNRPIKKRTYQPQTHANITYE